MALRAVDLIFDVREMSTKLTGSVNYRKERSDDYHLANLIRIFDDVLRAIVKDPNQVISDGRSNAWT